MRKNKLMKNCLWLLSILLVCAFALAGCETTTTTVQTDEIYEYVNPEAVKAELDDGFVIDGVLDEEAYQNCNWLKLQNTQGGAGVDLAMTSFYGEKGMYIVFDVTESSPIYVNPNRATYLNSCVEMYLASSDVANMSSNHIFEIDMLPTGQLSFRQRTARGNWVNAASTGDIMACLGATTKGGPVNTEECAGYNLELFIPWEYMEKLGLNASEMKQNFVYINPVHITSYNYEGVNSGTDRYWYSFATQMGGNGWGDVSQYFRFGAQGVLGTVPVELVQGTNYAITGNDSVIPGMLTTVQITPDAGYALDSILVNGEEYIHQVSYNKDGSVTLELRGEKEGLKISASAEAVTDGNKTISGTVQVHKLGGDTLDGVSISYKGPTGEKPITLDAEGSFTLEGLEQGYYTITVEKKGYAPINRGIYLNRDIETDLVLEYQVFEAETGYNWILDDQNDGVLNRFGGSGKILSVDSYDKFGVEAVFKYNTELAAMSDADSFEQQRAGIQIKFSNGKYWRVNLLNENGVYKVQYAKHNESSLFTWKAVHKLTKEEIAQYQSDEGIKLSVLRDGNIAWVCLNDRPVAIEVLDNEYKEYTAQVGFEGWIANQEIDEMEYNIYEDLNRNLKYFYFTTNTSWDISRQLHGVLTLPGGGTNGIPFYYKYTDFDFAFTNVREHDYTGRKPGRTDLLLEFDTNGDGKADKTVSFGIVCTNPEKETCWVQTLGNANNHIAATRVQGLYKLDAEETEKYLNGYGVELRVIRKGTEVYVFVDGEEVAIWDLTQNNSGVTADTPVQLSIRHYDAKSDVVLGYTISGSVEDVQIDKIFKDNENWDLSNQLLGSVALPGGGTETSLQFFKKYQNIDLTVTAKENDTTGKKPGRTDVLFEFDLNNDGTADKNVSFGIIQLSGGRCAIQTLGWNKNHIPETRINELYELDYAETLKYKGEGIDLRVVRYGTNVYLYLEDKQVAVFDLTQNNSGVQADTKATVFLRHYDAVADQVVIPFEVTDQVEEPQIVEQPKPIFKKNHKWDLSRQNQGTVTVDGVEKIQGVASLPGGGTNTVVYYDQYADLDLTITAKENDTTGSKPGRTDVLFEFENGKNVSFGITKTSSGCWVQTLGINKNYIPATRINGLYKLNDEEAEKYLNGDGVALRLIRKGTDVYVLVEGEVVHTFDLTQNNSGVTADMMATVSLRHYDAAADQVDIPFMITSELAKVTIIDNSVNGTVAPEKDDYVIGAEVVLIGKSEDYYLSGLKVDGVEVELNADGTYKFTATKSSYTVEGTFAEKVFKDNASWDLRKQNLGTITVDGVEKIQGIASLPGGKTNAVAYRNQYTELDLTITAKENDTTGTKPGRTDVLFEFENGKNVSFGIVKTGSGCWVQTLGISKNYIPATRVNGLYKLSEAEAEKYLNGGGVELRVIRKGTDVYVQVEGEDVYKFDLTQNNSGVTADMKATVSLRHYDAAADQVDIPFTIAAEAPKVTITDNSVNGAVVTENASYAVGTEVVLSGEGNEGYYLAGLKIDGVEVALAADGTYSFIAEKFSYTVEGIFRAKIFKDNASWDLSKQNLGTVFVDGVEKVNGVASLPGGKTNAVEFYNQYTDIDLTVTAKENDTTGSKPGRTDVLFVFENGKNVSFGILYNAANETCRVRTLGLSKNYIPSNRYSSLYTLSAEESEKYLNGTGVELRLIRRGADVYVMVEGNVVYTFDLTQNNSGVTADMKATVSLRHYDAVADQVDLPFTLATEAPKVTITDNSVNGAVVTGSEEYVVGEEVVLSGTANDGYYLAGLKIDGAEVALAADGTYSFTATKSSYTVEGIFRVKLFKDNAAWDLSQQNLGTVVVDGVEKIKGVASLPGGGTNAVAFRNQYVDIDLTVTAKENDTTGSKPGRTDILFEFENGKNVSFGIVKTSSGCWVQTLGISKNYIPATRVNALYKLSDAEAEKYLTGDGVELRVIRVGTNVIVLVEGNVVSTFDLTQNNSGVTADMKATVSLRHYDAAADQVDIPFTITDQAEEPTVYGTGYVPVKGQQVKTTASFATFPRTIEVTFNRTNLTNRSILIGSCDGKTADYINLEAPINEGIIYLNMTLNGTTYRHSFNRVSVPAGETFRVTVVIEDAAVKCYVNGVLAQTRTASNGGDGSKSVAALLESAANANLPVGYGFGDDLRNTDAHYFIGTIYDVALWSDARTAEEIAQYTIADVGSAGYQDNLLAAYNFRAGYPVSAVDPFHTDLSGNGFTLAGTLNVGTTDVAPTAAYAMG